jgi:uncharacterized 2Fe-2S/4Fe-4S cluster protein (DUF4445 family)
MKRHTVTLMPSGMQQSFSQGTLLSDALLEMGLSLKTPCGGKGICGKCRAAVGHLPEEVLACRIPITADLVVHAALSACDEQPDMPHIPAASSLSLAVDIGTTSVRIALVDTTRKACFEIASFLNPQRRFGHDVISRIAGARDESNRQCLQSLISKGISVRIGNALRAMGIPGERVERVVFSGNTTMLYLLYGIDVAPLGRFPFLAETRDFPAVLAEELGIGPLGAARAHALPVLGAFTGADLVGGLALCRDMGIEKNAFFLDLGTNGELFLLDGEGRPHAASCAMGPALEGMNISWGMTADTGAITRILAGPDGLDYRMIGPGEPVGITGTALIDLAAIMLDKGLISPSGAFSFEDGLELPAPLSLDPGEERKEVRLWGSIRLTQRDIRSLQLAKGACLAASLMLLQEAGCSHSDMEHVFIAGAFGEHLDLDRFLRLGFMPDFGKARKEFLGNTSLRAAARACMDLDFTGRAAALRDRTREIVLSAMPGFQDLFIQSLIFSA